MQKAHEKLNVPMEIDVGDPVFPEEELGRTLPSLGPFEKPNDYSEALEVAILFIGGVHNPEVSAGPIAGTREEQLRILEEVRREAPELTDKEIDAVFARVRRDASIDHTQSTLTMFVPNTPNRISSLKNPLSVVKRVIEKYPESRLTYSFSEMHIRTRDMEELSAPKGYYE